MKRIPCAVLGASGVVGQHFMRMLVDHPYFELKVICAGDARVGSKLKTAKEQVDGGIPSAFESLEFDAIDVDLLVKKGIKIAFSALPTDVAKGIEKKAAKAGICIFSNAGANRMEPDVPILIPEINAPHIDLVKQQNTPGFIITNANCTTTGLTMALLPFLNLDIQKLVVASYQAISGAGYPGLSAMDINANVIPFIKNEEPKLVRESRKICGAFTGQSIESTTWHVFGHCIRVPTIIGHLISVHMELGSKTSFNQIKDAILTYEPPAEVRGLPTAPIQPVIYAEEPDRPQPRYDILLGEPKRAEGMAVVIGRIEVRDNIVRFISLSNNLVRGAAGGSVLNAELAYKKDLFS